MYTENLDMLVVIIIVAIAAIAGVWGNIKYGPGAATAEHLRQQRRKERRNERLQKIHKMHAAIVAKGALIVLQVGDFRRTLGQRADFVNRLSEQVESTLSEGYPKKADFEPVLESLMNQGLDEEKAFRTIEIQLADKQGRIDDYYVRWRQFLRQIGVTDRR